MALSWNDIVRLDREGRLPRTGNKEEPGAATVPQLVEVAAVTSDQHGRFVDWQAWRAVVSVLQAAKDGKLGFTFDRFVFNGDFTDWYELSRFVQDPEIVEPIDNDIAAFHDMASDVRNVLDNGEPIDVNPGNHEARYELYLRTDAKKLSGLKMLELQKVLELDRFGATMHQKCGFMFGTERVYHGEAVRQHPAESAKHEMMKWGTGGTSGHVHRLAVYPRTTSAGDSMWSESGCLCDLNAEYMTQRPNWQHGFVILFRYSDGTVHHELVRIKEGVVQGTIGMMMRSAA